MSTSRLIGTVLLIGGLICMAMAYQWSETGGDQLKHFFTGDYRDGTMWLGLIGVIASVVGLVSLVGSRRNTQG